MSEKVKNHILKSTVAGLALLLLAACGAAGGGASGGGAGDSSYYSYLTGPYSAVAGTWYSTSGPADTLVISGSGLTSSSLCTSKGQLSNISPQASCPLGADSCGTVVSTTNFTLGPSGCAPLGSLTCSYAVAGSILAYQCGAGGSTLFYAKAPPTLSTATNTNTSASTTTNTSVVLDPPLSFEFTLNGSQSAITPAFQTDNVLKVKFVPGTTQGNNFHSASELAVTLNTNGTDFSPTYTSNNHQYGLVGENSNVIDISGYITPGSNVQITVKSPKSNFYCTYAPNPFYYWDGTQYAPTNPHYNVYPGCRKAVFSNHNWSGKLIVQTSHTQGI